MPPENLLKQRIKNGKVVVALRIPIDTERSRLEDALAKDTFHLLYVDGQHSAFSEDQLVTLCATAENMGLPVQFRIPHTRQAHLVGRYLDLGLSAILVPEVVEQATVDDAVAYSYYPQVGLRSFGGSTRHGLKGWGGNVDPLAYAKWWNDYVVLAIQLESVEAISNARRLAKNGVDYVAFGPTDLRLSLAGHPNYPLQTVDACMQNVAEQLQGTGIRLGMAVTTVPEERDKYLEMGITIFQQSINR